MITRTRTIFAAAVALVALGALAPLQARPASAACNEPPAEIKRTVPSKSPISVTQTVNFNRVEGLIQETVSFDGVTHESLSIPDWLIQSYGGNRVALERDLEAGLLKDRGRCF
jgi:hypothetical protein